MNQVAVIHSAFGESPRTVALVDVSHMADKSVMDQLEYAYFRTQNIQGSWSKGPTFEHKGAVYDNGDYSEHVTVMTPLETRDGVEYGLRSTSMGDQLLIGNVKYDVSMFGFERMAA